MKNNFLTAIRCSLVLLISALLASGCTSSSPSDSNSGEAQTAANVSGGDGDGVISNDVTSGNANEPEAVIAGDTSSGNSIESAIAIAGDTTSNIQTESTGGTDDSTTVNNDEPVSDLEFPDSGNPVVVDPLIQNTILVSFDISVPAYQSNELRLEVGWGELTLTATWVGDEFWTVSSELPTETEELLTVTFFDNNGAIKLASFTQQFKTGLNATEAFQISADQFDIDQFDNDGDGVSNLDELIAGSDPTADVDSLLEVRDSIGIDTVGLSVTETLESQLSGQRPISITNQEQTGMGRTIDTNIQIDLNGSGTFTRDRVLSCEQDRISGNRTRVGNAISWKASRVDTDCDFASVIDLTNTVTIVDNNTRTYVEEGYYKRTGSFTTTYLTSSNFTGELVDETSLCKPVAGTFSETHTSNGYVQRIITTFVSKEIDDKYWRATEERKELVYPQMPNLTTYYDVTISEFFVRDLHFGGSARGEKQKFFICDFVDI